jgi:16S rRNA (cytidine1402-2'-O)-methyltransferase
MTNKGKLFLIPNIISEGTENQVLPPHVLQSLPSIGHFLVENIRTARRFLSALKVYAAIEDLSFTVLDKDTPETEVKGLFEPLFNGFNIGVISESGCPGIADPGALAVKFAHEHDITVVPLVGPSSILLSLMASGLNGQRFAFHGYLPVDSKEAAKAIRELEKESRLKHQTQIFIETPYRNNTIMQNLIQNLSGETRLCVGFDLTGQAEHILTKRINEWRAKTIEWSKKPAIFLFLA